MDGKTLYGRYADQLEDFWGRRRNRPAYSRDFKIAGHTVRLTGNDAQLLASADHAQPLYSTAPDAGSPPFHIHLIAWPMPMATGPLPDNLFDYIQYAGFDQWLALHLGSWGLCQVDLHRKQAVGVLAPALSEQPALVSRYLLNTILTNFLIASGYGFLHATGLLKGRKALLLMAPHNSGKSTAAMRLALSGYRLLSDSMIFVDGRSPPGLMGFPVGRLKLRPDMAAAFPRLAPLLEEEPARGEIKYAVDLRRLDPGLVCESIIQPSHIALCLLSRSESTTTHIRPATPEEVTEAVMANSLFYDTAEVWENNLARIAPLVELADCYHLVAGHDPDQLLAAVEAL
jgi:hypothetical protein